MLNLARDGLGVRRIDAVVITHYHCDAILGLDDLREHLKSLAGYRAEEGVFLARRRHLEALQRAAAALRAGASQLSGYGAGELLAEDLRLCQQHLGEITGALTSDQLLGEIFSSFCIGK